MNNTNYGVVLVTAGSPQEAEAIATSLVASELAACVNVKIRELHSYEVSKIIALPILAGSQPYLN